MLKRAQAKRPAQSVEVAVELTLHKEHHLAQFKHKPLVMLVVVAEALLKAHVLNVTARAESEALLNAKLIFPQVLTMVKL